MGLASGTRIGSYEIVAPIGAGGMGEVYRARDTRLGRDVAIKILPELFTNDAERLARFDREARVLASLNHPNIAAIYGLEDAGPHRALVLELVEGETLAERMGTGLGSTNAPRPVPIDDALAIARQIVDALDAAHEKGIIHRDLKPANIKLTPGGVVKVLDFGLAKYLGTGVQGDGSRDERPRDPSPLSPSMSPTLMTAATNAGVILGTAPYMSPEQARGKAVDKRSDVWAFGCVLYELLTGWRAFNAPEISDTLALILTKEPDWGALPANTPASIRRLLRRCLEKDRAKRLADISDARFDLQDTTPDGIAAATNVAAPRARLAWIVGAIATLGAGALAVPATRYLRQAPPEALVTRLELTTPPTTDPISFALSADGRQIAFVGLANNVPRLWLRSLDQQDSRPLAGTDNASYPFWSPDARAIGFFGDGKLKRIDVSSGSVLTLADAPNGRGGAWSPDDVILFSPGPTGELMRVTASGGSAVAATRLGPGMSSHRWPQFLPDGRHFLFFAALGSQELQGEYVASLNGDEPRRVVAAEAAAFFAPPSWLLVSRQNVLVAWSFDPARAVVSGEPVPVVQGVGVDSGLFRGSSSVTSQVLAHRTGGGRRRQLVWFDRTGASKGTVGEPDDNVLAYPDLAPGGGHLAVRRTLQGNVDIWLWDLLRGVSRRFTFDNNVDNGPVWATDGQHIVFASNRRNGINDLFEKSADGSADERMLLSTPEQKMPDSWSADGRLLLYASANAQTGSDLWALPMTGDGKPFPVVQTRFEEAAGQFSSDGKWIAYQSNESGRSEIYVRAFGGPASQWQLSTAGGIWPRWRPDGKELFYVAPDNRLMATSIHATPGTQSLQIGAPVALFLTRLASGGGVNVGGYGARPLYSVAPDGRFLMIVNADEAAAPVINVVLNWAAALTRR